MIGPVTEARIQSAFAEAAVITLAAACQVIGCDPKTLREMADAGIIRVVRIGAGKTRGYTEGDIRAYLTESAAPCPSTSQPRVPSSNTTSRSKVVDFTARRALKRAARPKK
jgi:hypothetical protein